MATRNLTTHYVRMRSTFQRDHPTDGSAATAGYDTSALTAGVPPLYVDRGDNVQREIETIAKRSAWARAKWRERGV